MLPDHQRDTYQESAKADASHEAKVAAHLQEIIRELSDPETAKEMMEEEGSLEALAPKLIAAVAAGWSLPQLAILLEAATMPIAERRAEKE